MSPAKIMNSSSISKVISKFPAICDLNISMSRVTKWRAGGLASLLISPRNQVELVNVLMLMREQKQNFLYSASQVTYCFRMVYLKYL